MRRKRFTVAAAAVLVVSSLASVGVADVRDPIEVRGLWRHGEVQGVALDGHGGVLVAGTEGSHAIVRRYASTGAVVWERTFSVPGRGRYVDARAGVAIGPDGTTYVAGLLTLRSGDVEFPDVGAYVRAYGPGGHLRWQRVVHRQAYDHDVATAVAAGPGGVVVAGYTTCFECVSHEGWLKAWDPTGGARWRDDFEFRGIPIAKRDAPNDVAVDRDGSVYVVGVVERLEDQYGGASPDDADIVVRRMTGAGRTVWTHVLADRSKDSDEPWSVAVRGGRVVVGALVGAFESGPAPHPWVRAYSTAGTRLWTKTSAERVDWQDEPAVGIGRWGRVSLALPRFDRVRVLGLTRAGWVRWSARLEGAQPVDLAVGDTVLRVVMQDPDVDRGRLATFRP